MTGTRPSPTKSFQATLLRAAEHGAVMCLKIEHGVSLSDVTDSKVSYSFECSEASIAKLSARVLVR